MTADPPIRKAGGGGPHNLYCDLANDVQCSHLIRNFLIRNPDACSDPRNVESPAGTTHESRPRR